MKAEILNHFGDDLMVVNVAKVSYDKESKDLGYKEGRLLNFLAEHGHTTPFRHPQIQFRLEVPIFVERQLFTHQIGWARNSISGRYVDFSNKYWTPETLRYQSSDSKQGSGGDLSKDDSDYFIAKINNIIQQSSDLYAEMEEFNIAKEMCRIHLPLSLMTKFIWTGSLHAFVHLCKLRLKPDAQKETRDVVSMMIQLVKDLDDKPFERSLEAFKL